MCGTGQSTRTKFEAAVHTTDRRCTATAYIVRVYSHTPSISVLYTAHTLEPGGVHKGSPRSAARWQLIRANRRVPTMMSCINQFSRYSSRACAHHGRRHPSGRAAHTTSAAKEVINKQPISMAMDEKLYGYLMKHTREPEVRTCPASHSAPLLRCLPLPAQRMSWLDLSWGLPVQCWACASPALQLLVVDRVRRHVQRLAVTWL